MICPAMNSTKLQDPNRAVREEHLKRYLQYDGTAETYIPSTTSGIWCPVHSKLEVQSLVAKWRHMSSLIVWLPCWAHTCENFHVLSTKRYCAMCKVCDFASAVWDGRKVAKFAICRNCRKSRKIDRLCCKKYISRRNNTVQDVLKEQWTHGISNLSGIYGKDH